MKLPSLISILKNTTYEDVFQEDINPSSSERNDADVLSSQEVGNNLANRYSTRRFSRSVESRKVPIQIAIDIENRRDISAPVAVVRS